MARKRSLTMFTKDGLTLHYPEDKRAIMSIYMQNCRDDRNAGHGAGAVAESNIASQDLVGLDVKVVDSGNRELVGVSGTIRYETMNTFYLYTLDGEKQLPKKGSVWEFAANGSRIRMDGSDLAKRPAGRTGRTG